jgi:hypothetical protein
VPTALDRIVLTVVSDPHGPCAQRVRDTLRAASGRAVLRRLSEAGRLLRALPEDYRSQVLDDRRGCSRLYRELLTPYDQAELAAWHRVLVAERHPTKLQAIRAGMEHWGAGPGRPTARDHKAAHEAAHEAIGCGN